MRLALLAGLSLSFVLAAGCRPKQPPAEETIQPTTDTPTLAQLRKSFEENPQVAAVGVVQDIAPDLQLAIVADLNTAGIKEGDPISFIGTGGAASAGQVLTVKEGELGVSYKGGAAPARGDLAVRFKQ